MKGVKGVAGGACRTCKWRKKEAEGGEICCSITLCFFHPRYYYTSILEAMAAGQYYEYETERTERRD
jgi:hypothetical protein